MTAAADFIALLKHDVTATLGGTRAHAVDRHARRMLPFAEWSDGLGQRLVDDVQQEFHDTFVHTTWPHCPAHPNHPLWFADGMWRCTDRGTTAVPLGELDAALFRDAVEGLRRGDFDRLAPLFAARADGGSAILEWHARGMFAEHPMELAEALSCACFLGRTPIVDALMDAGVDVTAGTGCGMDACIGPSIVASSKPCGV